MDGPHMMEVLKGGDVHKTLMQWIARLFELEREATAFFSCWNIMNHAEDLIPHPSFGLFVFPLNGSGFHPITTWYRVVQYD